MKITKKDIIIFITIFILSLIIFYGFITRHYASDTYNIMNRGYEEYAIKYSLNDGRPVMCLISLLANKINLNIEVYIVALTILAIITSCICVMLLRGTANKYKKPKNIFQEIFLILICYFTIFNFMYLDNLQFAECFVMALSILFYILASKILVEKEKKGLIKSCILVVLGILCYQGTLSIFVTTTFLFTVIKHNENKELRKIILKNIVIAGFFSIIAVLFNLVQIRISGYILDMYQGRMGGFKYIFRNIKYIMAETDLIMVNTSNLFPKWLFLAFLTGILIIIYIYNKKIKEINYDIPLGIVIIAFLATIAPAVMTLASFGAGRLMFSIGALIGLILMYAYVKTSIFESEKIISKLCIGVALVYFITVAVNSMNIIRQARKVEKLNEKECEYITSLMNGYENETGIELKYIAVYKDLNQTSFYKEIQTVSSITIRPLATEWADDGSINYYSGKKLKEIDVMESVYMQFFAGKDWDSLDKEQFIFIDNTLHYCRY